MAAGTAVPQPVTDHGPVPEHMAADAGSRVSGSGFPAQEEIGVPRLTTASMLPRSVRGFSRCDLYASVQQVRGVTRSADNQPAPSTVTRRAIPRCESW